MSLRSLLPILVCGLVLLAAGASRTGAEAGGMTILLSSGTRGRLESCG